MDGSATVEDIYAGVSAYSLGREPDEGGLPPMFDSLKMGERNLRSAAQFHDIC